MSKDARWDVGGESVNTMTEWDWASDYLAVNSQREYHRYGEMAPSNALEIIDFVVELVHYIGELQGEIIDMRSWMDAVGGEGWRE